MGIAKVSDDTTVEAELEVQPAAGAGGREASENGEDPSKDGHQLLGSGAIPHLLPPLVISGGELLTLLLMKIALVGHQVEITQARM